MQHQDAHHCRHGDVGIADSRFPPYHNASPSQTTKKTMGTCPVHLPCPILYPAVWNAYVIAGALAAILEEEQKSHTLD